jgi:2Fe-2S ferredoxin
MIMQNSIYITYINSLKEAYRIKISTHNPINLMETIRDLAYEDWGDCRGRAWCRTCHVALQLDEDSQEPKATRLDAEEAYALNQLDNRDHLSRLACQININPQLHNATLTYRGDDEPL